jgi:anti-sigma factor RsiW
MCPDETLLTAYLDDEVPSPWKERIEAHLDQCARCRDRVAQYRALRAALHVADAIDDAHLQEAAQRIQASLDSRIVELSRTPHSRRTLERHPILYTFSSKKIAVPLPVLAASLLLFVFFAGMAFGLFGWRRNVGQALALSTKLPAASNANIESLVSTLSQADPSQFVTIQAPGNISQPLTNTAPVYVIYNAADQKPTIMAIPAQGEAK